MLGFSLQARHTQKNPSYRLKSKRVIIYNNIENKKGPHRSTDDLPLSIDIKKSRVYPNR